MANVDLIRPRIEVHRRSHRRGRRGCHDRFVGEVGSCGIVDHCCSRGDRLLRLIDPIVVERITSERNHPLRQATDERLELRLRVLDHHVLIFRHKSSRKLQDRNVEHRRTRHLEAQHRMREHQTRIIHHLARSANIPPARRKSIAGVDVPRMGI